MSEDFEAPKDDLDKELPAGSEEHSDYKPADAKDANIKHQLSGMYQNWFLDYASYVILERAVPHIMDGLKPVQRRILHSMRRMEDGRYNKVANIVGHTMQFHPHGDASIGDALVQLGQKDLLACCVLARIVQRYHHKGEEILGRFCRRIHYFVNFHSSNKNFPFPNTK